MGFMSSIINVLNGVSSWFYELYLDVNGWVWPFWQTAPLFYQLSLLFNTLAWQFYYFSVWVNDVAGKVTQILSWGTIWSYILSYVPNLAAIRDWFYGWWSNVGSVISSWWATTQWTVQAWVQGARDFAASLFNQVNNALASLQTAWDSFKGKIPSIDQVVAWWGNWWGNILPQLGSWWNERLLEVQGLLDSAFVARQGLWSGWQDLRDQVVEFVSDPVEYIWGRFTDWFLGPEG